MTKLGFLEIRTSETLNATNVVINLFRSEDNGVLILRNMDGNTFTFNHNTTYLNILRKWSKVCIAYDFEKNEGQAAFNGVVSAFIKNPKTLPNYNGTFDAGIIKNSKANSDMFIIIGRYSFDKNPFIGYLANINVWDYQMDEDSLREITLCEKVVKDQGNLVNAFSNWKLTGSLVKKRFFSEEETRCNEGKHITNAFLPIPELTKQEAIDLCKKFGEDVYIAGDFKTKAKFDVYYEGLQANEKIQDCALTILGKTQYPILTR